MTNTSVIHSLVFLSSTQQMADDLKWVDKQFKDMRPKFLTLKKKYDQMQKSRNQAANEVVEHQERVISLQSQLHQCQKVL